MIYLVTMYAAKCDVCGTSYYNEHHGWSCMASENDIAELMDNDNWHEYEGKHYCPDCFTTDSDDNVHLKPIP